MYNCDVSSDKQNENGHGLASFNFWNTIARGNDIKYLSLRESKRENIFGCLPRSVK